MDVEILREQHDLGEDSVFYVIGGHSGDISDRIIKKFNPHTHIFEPSKNWFEFLTNKYKDNPKVKIFNFGFAKKSGDYKLYIYGDKEGYEGDGSNIYVESENFETIKLVEFSSYLKDNNVKKIDLIEFNCEGAEYEIIDELFESNMLGAIGIVQVQFHKIDEHNLLIEKSRNQLSQTHNQKWNIPFIFECWNLK